MARPAVPIRKPLTKSSSSRRRSSTCATAPSRYAISKCWRSSPLAISRKPAPTSGSSVQLSAVTRDPNRVPTQAQWRALLTYLTDRCPPSLAALNGIVPVPPRLVQVQLALTLDIESVDVSGAVALAVSDAIVALFDPATGGTMDKAGRWDFCPPESISRRPWRI